MHPLALIARVWVRVISSHTYTHARGNSTSAYEVEEARGWFSSRTRFRFNAEYVTALVIR